MSTRRFRITINGKVYDVEAEEVGQSTSDHPVSRPAEPEKTRPVHDEVVGRQKPAAPQEGTHAGAEASIDAPLPGLVLDVKVSPGQAVQAGQVLVILEAMKMENEIVAPDAGMVAQIRVAKGDSVSVGDVLVVLS